MWSIINNKNWDTIRERFSWIQDMEGVIQSPVYHQEGDVAIHTKLVVEAMLGLSEYQALAQQDQEILFAAALLHDVEKRSTTVIEPDGRITAKGHARKGAHTARKEIYRHHPAPFSIREQVCKLVAHHMVPYHIFEKPSPRRMLYQLSLDLDTTLLYFLAKADILGRICPDQKEMLEELEIFKAFCEEENCWGKAKSFASELGRYQFFQKEEASPDYTPFEKDCFEVVLMSALPGTGKDTYINKYLKDWPVVSIDALRRKNKVSPRDKKGNGQMVQLAKEQAKAFLRKRKSFVWNATNITKNMRSQSIDLFQRYGAKSRIIYLEVPYQDLVHQNRDRDYVVPQDVLEKMIRKLEVPTLSEAPIVEYITD